MTPGQNVLHLVQLNGNLCFSNVVRTSKKEAIILGQAQFQKIMGFGQKKSEHRSVKPKQTWFWPGKYRKYVKHKLIFTNFVLFSLMIFNKIEL